ncbi:peroxisomal membrane protein PEX14-like isoform X1 [Canna indica]|uniref:Peroxisomal membrane protein PEX14 n=1 Tax=Canna indica TaxID=4628 RepID=A0AAQ3K5S7_9LILI|nr:peroxisomal membrane protein PEX14-like isoform X1 [Canna indica]
MDRPEQTSTVAMVIQSPSPPAPPGENPSTPGSETPRPVTGNGNDIKIDAVNEISEKPLLREDQVQNAVKFLSHPRVRSSPVVHRRSFLEKKGLTKEEIDEAFRRVPDPSSSPMNGEVYTANPAVNQKSPTTLERQNPAQTPQPAASPLSVVPTTPTPTQRLPKFHWSHALIAAGVLAASGVGSAVLFKNVVIPRLKTWIKKVVAEESESEKEDTLSSKLAEEAAEAAKAAASAAAVVAKASEELLSSKNEERKYFEAFFGALDVQVKELKSMGDAIRRLENTTADRFSEDKLIQENSLPIGNGPINNTWRTSQRLRVNGMPNTNYTEVRSSSPPMFMESLSGPNRNLFHEPREVSRSAQQRPSYSLQSQSSDEGLLSRSEESYGPPEMTTNAHDASQPWWLKKNVKVTEVEHEDEQKQFHYGIEVDKRPKPRAWVPPSPPPVVMPEAAAAIRRPKPSVQKQQPGDEQSIASSEDGKEREMQVANSIPEAEESDSVLDGTIQTETQDEKMVSRLTEGLESS